MKLNFKPEDFETESFYELAQLYRHRPIVDQIKTAEAYNALHKEAARIANARLAEMLKEAQVIYGRENKLWHGKMLWDEIHGDNDTHKAKLVEIEEIK